MKRETIYLRGGVVKNSVQEPIDGEGTVEVENPAEALRDQDGAFKVTSPYGHVFRVICRRGAKMSVREISEPQRVSAAENVTWRIKRVAKAVA